MTPADPLTLCATGESAWHAAAYAGLRRPWQWDDDIAWAPAGVPHRFLLAAVTRVPRPVLPAQLLADRPGILCDTWAALTPADLPGWSPSAADPWMARDPGPCPAPALDGVTVERTTDALLFEDAAFRAGGGRPPDNPGELHPAGSADLPGLTLLLARRAGRPVGTALAVEYGPGIVVSAVAVLESERGRGVGGLLTASAVNVRTDLCATLSASALGLPVYRRLGFRELSRSVHWHPPEPPGDEKAGPGRS